MGNPGSQWFLKMQMFSLPSKKADVILLILLLATGFIPIELNALNFFLGDDEWFRIWYNESLAWGLVLIVVNAFAVFRSISSFRQGPLFCGTIAAAAVFAILIVIAAVVHDGLGLSSKEDSPHLEMWGFWTTGGGWLTWLIIVPLGIAYFALRGIEQPAAK